MTASPSPSVADHDTPAFSPQQRVFIMLFGSIAASFVLVAVIGGLLRYCPVPFWDAWDGTLNFTMRMIEGDHPNWWVQHNEHRFIFSRLLFWLDMRFFGGTAKFLIVCNYLLVMLGYWVLMLYLKAMLPQSKERYARYLVAAVIACLSFSWIQKENLIWGFQSQFILAQAFPLAAFYLLYRSTVEGSHSVRYFAGACAMGVLSMGGIISGVLTLPLMTLLALLLSIQRRRVVVLALLTLSGLVGYFYDYVAPAHHGALGTTLVEQPANVIRFILLYLGGPIHFTPIGASELALFLGVLMLYLCLKHTEIALADRSRAALRLSLLAFMLYIGGTVLGTAGGRLKFGLAAAFWERYMTLALASWCVLLVLCAPQIAAGLRLKPLRSAIGLLLVPVLLAPAQLSALIRSDSCDWQMKAALALALGVHDGVRIKAVYPEPPVVEQIAARAAALNLSVFALPEFKDAKADLGTVWPMATAQCIGFVDNFEITEDPRFVRVSGWLYSPSSKVPPKTIRLLDEEHHVVGHALSGGFRLDVAGVVGPKAVTSGFEGYLRSEFSTQATILSADRGVCEVHAVPGVLKAMP